MTSTPRDPLSPGPAQGPIGQPQSDTVTTGGPLGHLAPWQRVTRVAADSDDLHALSKAKTPVVFTYADKFSSRGEFEDTAGQYFPGQILGLLDRGLGDPAGLAIGADVERFALRPDQAPRLFDEATHARGIDQYTVYASLNRYPMIDHHMGDRDFYRWIAWWGHAQAPHYPWAMVQFANSTAISTGYDLSLIWNPLYLRPAP